MRTILFGAGSEKCDIKLEAYDMRERYTSTSTLLGTAQTNMAEQKNGERIRLKLESPNPDGRTAGFVTITSWIFDLKIPASTDSTPVHRPTHGKNPIFKINDMKLVHVFLYEIFVC